MSATAILYGIQAAAGLGQSIYGYQQMQEAQRREALLRAQGLPKMQTPQEYFDLYQNASRSKQFEQEKAMTQSILASNLATLQQAGSRALIGAAPAATLQAQRGMAQAAGRDYARQQAALEALASAQARTAALNFQAESAQYARDLLSAQAGYQAGAETMMSGAETALGAGALAVGAAKGRQQPAPKDLKPAEVPAVAEVPGGAATATQDRGLVFGGPSAGPPASRGAYFEEMLKALGGIQPIELEEEADIPLGFGAPAPFDAYSSRPHSNPEYYRQEGFHAKGGPITTPGKYTADHSVEYDVKTKGGKTIATVTGDETLVFNPEQRRFLKRIIGRLFKGGPIRLRKNERKAAQETFKAFKR